MLGVVTIFFQGVSPGEKSFCWDMQVDVDETEKGSREQVSEILGEIGDAAEEHGASPQTYQSFQNKSHHQLLDDIAGTGFSRSYLRRRIELVRENLGPSLA